MDKSILHDIQIKFLVDVPHYIPTLAQWTYDAWKQYDPTLCLENVIASLKTRLHTKNLPLTYVAISDGEPVGMVSLKPKIKLAGYADRTIWLGSYFVVKQYRRQGIGTYLVHCALNKARELGYQKISLFTSDPLAVIGYEKQGWTKFATDMYQGHPVAMMEYVL